jgi:DNA mismatch endonuclease (patch repair protein)
MVGRCHMIAIAKDTAWLGVPEARRNVMRANKGKGSKPELVVRRLVHGMGYRYRVHKRDLPGTPDLTFAGRKAVVQVHGCFWHQHPGCRRAHVPATRTDYWGPKLARNVHRDRRDEDALREMGWRVLVVWECELRDRTALAARLQEFLGSRPVPQQRTDR